MSVFEHFDDFYEIEPEQRLMLESLVCEAPRDQASFARWLAGVDLDALDNFAFRLVPALYRKYGEMQSGDPRMERMKGVYRYFHLRNSLLFADGRRAIEALVDAGIDVLIFKGIAIALKYHRGIAERPMADVDVLVRHESVPKAEEIMRRQGWKNVRPNGRALADFHSHDYVNVRRSGFDLHWYSLYESRIPGIDDGIWRRAGFFDWNGFVVKLMSPEDLLFTNLINGVREVHPLRAHWVHDLACIVAAEPAIAWSTLWDEARKRGLRESVFNALSLARGISGDIVSDSLLHTFVDNDPEFRRELLATVVAEGRTQGLSRAARDKARAGSAGSPGSPQHIRVCLDDNGAVEALYLQWRHLPMLADLFEVGDPPALQALVVDRQGTGEGRLDARPARLAIKARPVLPTYSARISVIDARQELVLAPGEIGQVSLQVENSSPCCWPVNAGSKQLFGVSYHLLSEDGRSLVSELPRTYLATARRGYLAFIEPNQKVACELLVSAPKEPGRYRLQLDLVHELVAWFSARGCQFPQVRLEVRWPTPTGRFSVSGSGIVHETIGGESLIVNTASDCYYTTEGYGSIVWNAIVEGFDAGRIVAAFAEAQLFDAADQVVESFIASLIAEGLIAARPTGATQPRKALRVEARPGSQAPRLTKHAPPRDLIAMHPLRGASVRAGWPHPPDTE